MIVGDRKVRFNSFATVVYFYLVCGNIARYNFARNRPLVSVRFLVVVKRFAFVSDVFFYSTFGEYFE